MIDLVWMTFPLKTSDPKQPQAGGVFFCEWNFAKLREFSKSDLNFKEKQEVWDAGDSVTLAREECPYPCDCVSLYVFRSPVSVISPAVVEAVCGCQLARAKEAEREAQSPSQAEHMVLDEFGHCLTQIVVAIFQNKAH